MYSSETELSFGLERLEYGSGVSGTYELIIGYVT